MTDAQTLAEPHWSRPLAERQIAILGELAEAGLEIALTLRDRIKANDATDNLPAAYAKAARAVRLSLMLQDKLIQDLKRHEAGLASTFDPPDLQARKTRVHNIVRRIGDNAHRNRDRLDRMCTERLDRDVCGDILSRPISEIVAQICKDIELSPKWTQLAQEAWAQAEIAGGETGWPLKALAKTVRPTADRHTDSAPRSPKTLE